MDAERERKPEPQPQPAPQEPPRGKTALYPPQLFGWLALGLTGPATVVFWRLLNRYSRFPKEAMLPLIALGLVFTALALWQTRGARDKRGRGPARWALVFHGWNFAWLLWFVWWGIFVWGD